MPDDLKREQLDEYLDGTLDSAQRAAFEARLSDDPALREALSSQQAIDAALRQSFAVPIINVEVLLSRLEQPAGEMSSVQPVARGKPSWPWWRPFAVAAAIMIAAAGVWQAWPYFQPKKYKYTITAATYFVNKEQQGFRPSWVCENDQQTIDIFNKHLGQPMVLQSPPADVKALGWDYAPILSPTTIVLLAEAGPEHVMLCIDRKSADNMAIMHEGCSGLNVHRKEVGDLVVYEYSRLPEARVMDFLVEPTS